MSELEQTVDTSAPESAVSENTQEPVPQTVEPTETAPVVPEIPAYTPSFKFKANGEEHEFPEYVRGGLTDVEKEKELKEVFEKAYGLDPVKNNLKEYQSKYDSLLSKHVPLERSVEEVKQAYQKGDLDTVFQKLNIPHDVLLQYVAAKLKYNELPPEQKQVLDQKRSVEQRLTQFERLNEELQTKYQEQVMAAKKFALDINLGKDDVKAASDFYDAQVGKPGAFRDLVVDRGKYHWHESQGKVDLTPEQAIQEALKIIAWKGKPESPQPLGAATASARKEPTVIPNISGRATSPVQRQPKSLDDLKEMLKHMQAQG